MTQLEKEYVKEFAFAGNATITLQSGNTGKHFTYKLKRSKDQPNLYFIHLLHGPDNEEDYKYIGCYYKDNNYFHPAKQFQMTPRQMFPPALRAIDYFFMKIDNLPDNLYVFHEGRCGRCGRKLTTPESIQRGLGPECYKESKR